MIRLILVLTDSLLDNAYLEAQKVGKVPALCEADSPFQRYYPGCYKCIEQNISTAGNVTAFVDPKFAQFIDFCTANDPAFESVPVETTSQAPPETNLPQTVIVQTVTFTLPDGQVTHGSATTTLDTLDRGPSQSKPSNHTPHMQDASWGIDRDTAASKLTCDIK